MMNKVNDLIKYCQINNRICPKPQKWNKLWQLLNNKQRKGATWEPSLPLILAAWYNTSNDLKKERLIEHLKWAEKQNQLDTINNYLHTLTEEDWHHENE